MIVEAPHDPQIYGAILEAAALPLCFVAATICAVKLFIRHCYVAKDISALTGCLRAVRNGGNIPPGIRLRYAPLQSIWSNIATLRQKSLFAVRERSAFQELLSLGAQIAEHSDELQFAATAVSQLIREQIGVGLRAIAIVLFDSKQEKASLLHLYGLPRERVEHALLSAFEDHFQHSTLWGFQQTPDLSLANFNTFGVSSTYLAPLQRPVAGGTQTVCGALWLGFGNSYATISRDRQRYIEALCDHAAATFCAAQRFEMRVAHNKQERDFLLGASHDLRAPGNNALFALRQLLGNEESRLNSEQQEMLLIVERSLMEQLERISNVLLLAKRDEGLLTTRPVSFELRDVLLGILADYRQSAERNGIQLQVYCPEELTLCCDLSHFRRIVENLFSNALKYGGKEVSVEVQTTKQVLEVLFHDRGESLLPEQQTLLFARFQQLDCRSRLDGVGLGLVTTKLLAELNGGTLFYRSRQPQGSTFGLRLPMHSPRTLAQEIVPLRASILILEDDRALARSYARSFEEKGWETVIAESLEEARQIVKKKSLAVVVSDLWIGREHSLRFLEELQLRSPSPQIILLTGETQPDISNKLPNIRVLEKPLSSAALTATVSALGHLSHENGPPPGDFLGISPAHGSALR